MRPTLVIASVVAVLATSGIANAARGISLSAGVSVTDGSGGVVGQLEFGQTLTVEGSLGDASVGVSIDGDEIIEGVVPIASIAIEAEDGLCFEVGLDAALDNKDLVKASFQGTGGDSSDETTGYYADSLTLNLSFVASLQPGVQLCLEFGPPKLLAKNGAWPETHEVLRDPEKVQKMVAVAFTNRFVPGQSLELGLERSPPFTVKAGGTFKIGVEAYCIDEARLAPTTDDLLRPVSEPLDDSVQEVLAQREQLSADEVLDCIWAVRRGTDDYLRDRLAKPGLGGRLFDEDSAADVTGIDYLRQEVGQDREALIAAAYFAGKWIYKDKPFCWLPEIPSEYPLSLEEVEQVVASVAAALPAAP